ncbi:MAG TPA: flagellar biosynthetic protein FliO, partial [Candidatus Hydrogenedentes bacterium]|nr:flagellar biosynthetic protein FliO [Candidatus Hydrogenedentota bacterium]
MKRVLLLAAPIVTVCAVMATAQTTPDAIRDRAAFGAANKEPLDLPTPEAAEGETTSAIPANTYAAAPPPPPPTTPPPPPSPTPPPDYMTALQREYDGPAAAAPGEAPPRETPGFPRMLLTAIMWLCLVCAAIILVAYLLRKLGRRTPLLAGQQYGEVLGRLYLTPRVGLHYVRSGDRVLIIAVTRDTARLITEFDAEAFLREPGESAPRGASSGRFLERLRANLAQETAETS